VCHSLDAYGVEVSGEHQGGGSRRADARDNIRAAQRRFLELCLKTPPRQEVAELVGDCDLARGLGREGRVSGVDPDQRPGQRDRVAAGNLDRYFLFLAAGFFAAGFLAGAFFAAGFFGAAFFAGAAAFLAGAFFAGGAAFFAAGAFGDVE
jgi:hypothetical protein